MNFAKQGPDRGNQDVVNPSTEREKKLSQPLQMYTQRWRASQN